MASSELTRYRTWTGDLDALVGLAASIQGNLGLLHEGTAPNVRLVRHYQTIGCVGKPAEREAGRGLYGYRQLLELVSIRVLLDDGWKLVKISELLARLGDVEIEELITSRGTVTGGGEAGTGQSKPPDGQAQAALALIEGFRKSAGLAPAPAPQPPGSGASMDYARERATNIPLRRTDEYQVAPWLRISIDPAALANASPGAAIRSLAEASALLGRLTESIHQRNREKQ